MARDLSNAPGIGTDSDFLNSNRIKNNKTTVGEYVYQDIVQFFQKILSLAGITPNDNFDNEINGYQLVDAYKKAMYIEHNSVLVNDSTKKIQLFVTGSATLGYYVTIIGTIVKNTSSSSVSNLIPSNYRPSDFVNTIRAIVYDGNARLSIWPDGTVLYENSDAVYDHIVNIQYFVNP